MTNETNSSKANTIIFFIDKTKFSTERAEITAQELLTVYAEEDPSETTLVLKEGNDLTKYTDGNSVIHLKNGMHFVVFYNGPTVVSFYGPDRLIAELTDLGYEPKLLRAQDNHTYVILPDYVVPVGRFQGRIIDLGIPATANFPLSVGASIHIKSVPHLFDKSDSLQNVRNIIDSALGPDWRYWSRNFNWANQKQKNAKHLLAQIAGVFENA